jgi:hypothetical protein
MIPIEKNIAVYDPSGALLEATYPRRAAGLVKKGRARFTAPDSITLNARPPGTEDFMIDNINEAAETAARTTSADTIAPETTAITETIPTETAVNDTPPTDKTALDLVNRYRGFVLEMKPREWKKNTDASKGVCDRIFYTEDNGDFRELWQVGDWNWNWSEIITGDMRLETYTEYRMIFWLKDGKNRDGYDCVCRFQITFDRDIENRNIYNLSNGFVKPLMTKGEWKLFCIPFNTGGNESLTLRFVAQHAPIYIKPAFYDELGEILIDNQQDKPQEKLPLADVNDGDFGGHVRELQEHFDELEDMIEDGMATDEIIDQIDIMSDIVGRLSSVVALRNMKHY